MRDKVAVLAWLNDNFQVHRGNFVLRMQDYKRKAPSFSLEKLKSPFAPQVNTRGN